MASPPAEPLLKALGSLRARLRDGAYPPGARLAAAVIAQELRLSATPVREALSRLTGEGLLEDRRGQGFFVRQLTAPDIADLYRLSMAQVRIALEAERGRWRGPESDRAAPAASPVERVEALFANWVAAGGSRALWRAHLRLQTQLGPIRRLEPLLLDDLDAEAEALAAAPSQAMRRVLMRRFHSRRVRLSERLAVLAADSGRGGG